MFLVSLFLFYGVVMMGARNFSMANFSRYKNLPWKNFLCAVGNISDTIIFKRYISPQVTEIYDFAGRNFE